MATPPSAPELADLEGLSKERLVERARGLAILLGVTEAIANTSDLREMAEAAVAAIVRYTSFPSVVLFHYDDRNQTFNALAARGVDLGRYTVSGVMLPMGGSLTGLATTLREVVTTEDIRNDPRVAAGMRESLSRDGYVGGLSVPLICRDQVMGALNMVYPTAVSLAPYQRELLTAIGGTLAATMAQHLARDQQRLLEQQARRAQQLESLGVLAGGIAHDFNNLLVGILGNLELAIDQLESTNLPDVQRRLTDARAAADRARGLVRQLLTFAAGRAPLKQTTHDLANVVQEAGRFALHGASVGCSFDFAAELGTVAVDTTQIAQVVQNLVLNAAQASAPGATVRVRLTRQTLSTPEPPRAAGPWLCLEVADSGRGIPPENLERIFEPFFSSRPGGSGLGLAVAHSIVRAHGGHIQVTSRVDEGTTFTVFLPAESAADTARATAHVAHSSHSGRALVMDDEPSVLRVAKLMLERLGFEVSSAPSGDDALGLVRASMGAPFALALLDVTVIGGRGGYDILDELRRLAPATAVIVTSGYAERLPAPPAATRPHATLPKPFTLSELGHAVEQARAAVV